MTDEKDYFRTWYVRNRTKYLKMQRLRYKINKLKRDLQPNTENDEGNRTKRKYRKVLASDTLNAMLSELEKQKKKVKLKVPKTKPNKTKVNKIKRKSLIVSFD